jgi:putative ABC transport system substrate-binding protein
VNSREFIVLVGGAVAWPIAAQAQQAGKLPVIGYFSARSPDSDVPMVAAFREGLAETGYLEGRTVTIEFRWARGQYDRLPDIAQELVRQNVAIIVTSGGEITALAAKAATTTIPIVFNAGGDPVQTGLVASFNRPGGNLTGVSSMLSALAAKKLGLLRELAPGAAVMAILVDHYQPSAAAQISDAQTAARVLSQPLIVLQAGTPSEIEAVFATLAQQRAGALLVSAGPFFTTQANQLVALAARHAIPTIYFRREFVEAGGLMSYASSTADSYRQMGNYTGRILKGEKPADLPIQTPTRFELVINMKTAKTLNLTIPSGIHSIIDEVIE